MKKGEELTNRHAIQANTFTDTIPSLPNPPLQIIQALSGNLSSCCSVRQTWVRLTKTCKLNNLRIDSCALKKNKILPSNSEHHDKLGPKMRDSKAQTQASTKTFSLRISKAAMTHACKGKPSSECYYLEQETAPTPCAWPNPWATQITLPSLVIRQTRRLLSCNGRGHKLLWFFDKWSAAHVLTTSANLTIQFSSLNLCPHSSERVRTHTARHGALQPGIPAQRFISGCIRAVGTLSSSTVFMHSSPSVSH